MARAIFSPLLASRTTTNNRLHRVGLQDTLLLRGEQRLGPENVPGLLGVGRRDQVRPDPALRAASRIIFGPSAPAPAGPWAPSG
jgi:hypothetical protein